MADLLEKNIKTKENLTFLQKFFTRHVIQFSLRIFQSFLPGVAALVVVFFPLPELRHEQKLVNGSSLISLIWEISGSEEVFFRYTGVESGKR